MKKSIGALIFAVLFAAPTAAFAQYTISPGYYYGDQCYCSGQGGMYRDPVLYSYTPVYGVGGAGYDSYGNYGPVAPTYPVNNGPNYAYPSYAYYQQPQYSYQPSYYYPQYQQPSYYYPQQYSYPYLYNPNTNYVNFTNTITNNNSSPYMSIFGYGW